MNAMIDAQGNQIRITRIREDPSAGTSLCEIEIATRNVRTCGTRWLMTSDIEAYNSGLDELKARRNVVLAIRGEYVGALELNLAPYRSMGAYRITISCHFGNDAKRDLADYGVMDDFIVDGEFVNQAFSPIPADARGA